MKWRPDASILELNLVELEHCGFDHSELQFELAVHGIDDPAARWPAVMLVNFAGGGIITQETTPATLQKMDAANAAFRRLRNLLQVVQREREG